MNSCMPTIKFGEFEITGHIHSPQHLNIQCSIWVEEFYPNEDEFGCNSGWDIVEYYHICTSDGVGYQDILDKNPDKARIVYKDREYTIVKERFSSVYSGIDY